MLNIAIVLTGGSNCPDRPKNALVRHDPEVVHFKPAGVPMRLLKEVSLG